MRLFIACSSFIAAAVLAAPVEYAILIEPSRDQQIPRPPTAGSSTAAILIPVDAPSISVEEDDRDDGSLRLLTKLRGQAGQDEYAPEIREEDALLGAIERALTSIVDFGDGSLGVRRLTARSLKSTEEYEDGYNSEEREDHGRQRRSALNVIIKRGAEQDGPGPGPQRADESTPAPAGGFLETIQGQLPGQLQGLGSAMEDSEMVVGTFQAIIMPGSAATDLGQQIQGFISNMPQLPGAGQAPG